MNHSLLSLFLGVMCCVYSALPGVAASPFIISEFMASNVRSLADEDGDFSDWIEIQNVSTAPASLKGYFLTDNPGNLAKWAFPDMTLLPGGNLVLFASGKNRTNTAGRLHTNFQLDGNGEFLALVQDTNAVQLFNPFPPQKDDISYGIAQQVVTTALLPNSIPQILVPTSAADLASNWNQLDFVSGANWFTGAPPAAIGFDTNKSAAAPGNVALSGTAVQSTVNGSYTPNLAINGNLSDFTHTLGTDTAPFWQLTLTNNFSISRIILYNRSSCCQSRLRDIKVQILSTNATGTITNWQSILLNPENAGYSYTNSPNGPMMITNDLVALTGSPVNGQFIRISRMPDPDLSGSGGQGNSDEAAVLSLGEVVVEGAMGSDFGQYIRTDIQTQMLGHNASAFVRVPFMMTNPVAPDRLTLQMRYDDGFIAYLNGVEVARRNAPDNPAWDSGAVTNRTLAGASLSESIDITANASLLANGTNVLAIQAMNVDTNNSDFLVVPTLNYTFLLVSSNAYLVDATPGALNNTEFYYGEVADTTFSVDRGFFTAPISLVITSTTPDAVIYYSFNGDEPGPTKGALYTGPLTIANTTIVRARAFKPGLKPTAVDTHTYLFLGDVIYQAANWEQTHIPPPYFPSSWGANSVDYGMDPQVVANYTPAQWQEALTQIPSMSIVTEMKNLFDPTTGIYANASGQGEDWERPMSIELLDPTNAVPGRFQENGGLRIRGGYSRNPSFFKHSFRIFFNRGYGAASLKYPLFEGEGAQEFDKFDLRTSQNYSWPRGAESPTYDTMVREVFCRKTLGDLGQPYRRSRYYHLYLNGQYWGLYETDERPSASYGASYFGGEKDNYDVMKCGNRGVTPNFATEATDGNSTAWSNLWTVCQSMRTNASDANYFRTLGCNPNGSRNPALPVLLDVDNLIDYMLEIFYSGDGDATLSSFLGNNQANNWYGIRDRTNPDVGFRFFNSDCEHTLGSPSSQVDRTGPFGGSNEGIFIWSNPQWMHEELMRNAEYRLRFADHVQKHFFNHGALTLEACTNRFMAKAVQINKAIRAYSARWGDAYRTNQAYGESDWTAAIAYCLNWFPTRADIVLTQLKADNLVSAITAPNFSQQGGNITSGYALTMSHTNVGGTIYYTLDGTDPRVVGGAVSSTAVAYTTPVVLNTGTRVKARVLSGTTWSALNQADFIAPEIMALRITELMYHPAPVTPAEFALGYTNADDFEYVELRNVGTTSLSLAGVSFVDGITFTFSSGTLAAGERLLLVKNQAAFTQRYGASTRIAGVYGGNLNNAGERLRFQDAAGRIIQSFTYSDTWYPITDGYGFSLTVVDDAAPVSLWDKKSNWRQSGTPNGSPGTANLAPPLFPFVVINELLTRPAPGDQESVELANLGDTPADISGWWLSDDIRQPLKYRIPTNTVVPVGGFLVITEAAFANPAQGINAFAWDGSSGEVRLFSANASGDLTGYYQGWDFGPTDEGVTLGRYVISTGADHFVMQKSPSLGTTNAGPRVGPVVIGEIMYHPPDLGTNDNTRDEFIELVNISSNSVPLFDPAVPTNTWRITGGVDFIFPTNLVLASGERLLVVNFDPTADPLTLENLRQRYYFATNVPVFGPYGGKLNNNQDNIELKHPTLYQSGFADYTIVDKVAYEDAPPWPCGADGGGSSIQRLDASQYGNDPINWQADLPTPGAATVIRPPGPPTVLTQPAPTVVPVGGLAQLGVEVCSFGTVAYQWRFNGTVLPNETNQTLVIANIQTNQTGFYSVVASNTAGKVESSDAWLVVQTAPLILTAPQSQVVTGYTTVSLSVDVGITPPFHYQWQFNSNNIAGANSATLVLTNVQKNTHQGTYSVVVWNTAGQVVSSNAQLTVNMPAHITAQPVGIAIANDYPISFVSTATGDGVVGYQWYFNNALLPGATADTYRINSVQNTNAGTYFVVVSNAFGMDTSLVAQLTVFLKPVYLSRPIPQVVTVGEGMQMSVVVTGTPPFQFTWKRGTTPMATNYAVDNLSTDTLVIPRVMPTDAGSYVCVTTNVANGGVYSLPQAPLTVVQPPDDRQVLQGSNITLRALVWAVSSAPKYQWQFNNVDIPGATAASLLLTNVQPAQAGTYRLMVTNQVARWYACSLTVQATAEAPQVAASPESTSAMLGGGAFLTVRATGTDPLTYQWWQNASNRVVWATNSWLIWTNVQATNYGDYVAVVSNAWGMATSAVATLGPLAAPIILESPTNVTVAVGGTATLSARVSGADPMTYQWWKNATNLVGSTRVLTLSNAQLTDTGSYVVVVSNALGMATSAVAVVTVENQGLVDTNGDGVPDAWERAYGLTVGVDERLIDSDGDGRSNWEEYISGTNPTNALSVLKITLSSATGNGATLSFTAMPNLGYSVLFQTNLASTTWLKLTNIAPQAGTNLIQITDPAARANKTIYYRIATPSAP